MKVPLRQIAKYVLPDGAPVWAALTAGSNGVPRPHALRHFRELAEILSLADRGGPLTDVEVNSDPLPSEARLTAPLDDQEIWAAGVTYLRSRDARQEESADGGDVYQRVYNADRPELFFKATPNRCVGPMGVITIRRDSTWNVPEPELTLVLTPGRTLFGFTVGNDVSSRSIEGANPLYLPQAKVYFGSAALGPTITRAAELADPYALPIRLTITRSGALAFAGETSTAKLKRRFDELADYLFRAQDFSHGVFLMTGTGIVPDSPFTLAAGDVVSIEIPGIGTLTNTVAVR